MVKSISFLLGAGFSAPMGFPIGNNLNSSLFLNDKFITFDWEGILVPRNGIVDYDGRIVASGKEIESIYNYRYKFLFDKIVPYYSEIKKQPINYEDFYDYYVKDAKNSKKLKTEFEHWKCSTNCNSYEQYLRNIDSIYQQIVKYYIKPLKQLKESLNVYNSFIESLHDLLIRGYTINIHTLNHDLLFESFKNSPLIGNDICDGYEYKDSPYRGYVGEQEVILPYYNKKYDKRIRLYKLHGSIDQYAYFKGGNYMTYDNHIKVGDTVSKKKQLFKIENGKTIDTFEFLDVRPDFLTGKKAKQDNYKRKYYQNILYRFCRNLRNSKCLIIIGYGGGDEGINKRIIKNLHSPCYVYDKYLNPNLEKLIKEVDTIYNYQETKVEDFKIPTTIYF